MDSLVWANLQHRPTRSLATAIGVAIGTMLILMTVGLARGVLAERATREARVGAHIMVRAAGSFTAGLSGNQPSYPVANVEKLKKIEGVRAVTPVIQYVMPAESGFGFRMMEGVDWPSYSEMSGIQIVKGRTAQAISEIVIDREQAKSKKLDVGGTFELMGRKYTVVGIYDPESSARIKIPLNNLQEIINAPGQCTMVLVQCENENQQEAVFKRIRDIFPNDQLVLMRDLPNLYANGLPALDRFLQVVIGLSAVISTMIILLAMYTTITERTREIGVLKSLGATNGFIVMIIEQEALLLSAGGTLLGILLAFGGRFLVTTFTNFRGMTFDPSLILMVFGVAIVGGALGALYPALRAARLDPVKALNYE
jgi:putative ABC transport system permease protein